MRTAAGSSPKNVKRCHDFHQVLPKHPQSTDGNPGMVTTCSQEFFVKSTRFDGIAVCQKCRQKIFPPQKNGIMGGYHVPIALRLINPQKMEVS
jgi:hypothetical protein